MEGVSARSENVNESPNSLQQGASLLLNSKIHGNQGTLIQAFPSPLPAVTNVTQ